jgi:hypothetical protein
MHIKQNKKRNGSLIKRRPCKSEGGGTHTVRYKDRVLSCTGKKRDDWWRGARASGKLQCGVIKAVTQVASRARRSESSLVGVSGCRESRSVGRPAATMMDPHRQRRTRPISHRRSPPSASTWHFLMMATSSAAFLLIAGVPLMSHNGNSPTHDADKRTWQLARCNTGPEDGDSGVVAALNVVSIVVYVLTGLCVICKPVQRRSRVLHGAFRCGLAVGGSMASLRLGLYVCDHGNAACRRRRQAPAAPSRRQWQDARHRAERGKGGTASLLVR